LACNVHCSPSETVEDYYRELPPRHAPSTYKPKR
jgi:hypothetical protein